MGKYALPIIAMIIVVASSNFLVQFPINNWLTWAALTYPISFLITDLTNRSYGPILARRVVYAGFALAIGLSIWLATPRIALASGLAFLIAQLLDVYVFDYLRRRVWWKPPLVSSTVGSAIDTVIFFSIAFVGTGVPWITIGIGDFGIKLAIAIGLLLPFRALIFLIKPDLARTS